MGIRRAGCGSSLSGGHVSAAIFQRKPHRLCRDRVGRRGLCAFCCNVRYCDESAGAWVLTLYEFVSSPGIVSHRGGEKWLVIDAREKRRSTPNPPILPL